MDIQINTDKHVAVDDQLRERVRHEVDDVLAHFEHAVTGVEVHFSDESPARAVGAHLRCLIEARLCGREPVTVEAGAATAVQALVTAAGRLETRLQHVYDRVGAARLRATIRGR